MVSREQLRESLKGVFLKDEITDDNFTEQDIDSLSRIEGVMLLEDSFDIEISDLEAMRMTNLDRVFVLINEKLKEKHGER